MSKRTVENEEVEFDIVDVLDEIASTENGLWYVLIAGGGMAGGWASAPGAYIMSRCLLEMESDSVFDAAGRFVRAHRSGRAKATAEAQRVRTRVRRALRDGQQTGAEFVLCYHVEGDPRWYMAWSDHHTKGSAVEAVKQYLTEGMLWA